MDPAEQLLHNIFAHDSGSRTMETRRFNRKSFPVDAVQVTEENMEKVAEWCGGRIQQTKGTPDRPAARFIKVDTHSPITHRQTKAFVGDWVSVRGKDFKVYTQGAFERNYDEDEEATDQGMDIPQAVNNVFDQAEVPNPGSAVFRR